MGPFDPNNQFGHTPRVQNTTRYDYTPPPLSVAPVSFPTANPAAGGGKQYGGESLLGGISTLMGGPAGMALSGISAIGNFLNAGAQRREEARKFNLAHGTQDNQFAATFGLNKDRQWFDKQGSLYDRERYASNQNAKLPMMQSIISRLGGIAGSGGLANVAAPSMDQLRAAGNASLGTYNAATSRHGGKKISDSSYRNV